MLNIRLKKIVFIIGVFIALFTIYELTNSPSRNELSKVAYVSNSLGNLHQIETGNALTETKVNTVFLNEYDELSKKDISKSKALPPLFEGHKIVHVDMKGAPVKTAYYKQLFSLISNLGASGVLMEYEDMFPYSNPYISAGNAYSKTDIEDILNAATENNLEVIPLIQTFGHLEFVLKLDQFKQLREVGKYPQAICPTNNKTVSLIKHMIDDIVELHPDSRYLHIGSDEVYQLGECSLCINTMMKNHWTKQQLFLSHVSTVARYVKEKYPKVKVLMWDDEFRKASLDQLVSSSLGTLVEPVVWKYTPDADVELTDSLWEKYSKVFRSVWIASAFKGATGPDKLVTDNNYHLDNHRAWMRLVEKHSRQINFKGIMMTGWQRYDHFAVLCELLPVGLPSLAVNLAFLAQGDIDMDHAPPSVMKLLSCGPGLLHSKSGARCHFPGSQIYEKAQQLQSLTERVSQLQESSEAKGWLTQYNVQSNFSNPVYVERATNEVNHYQMELQYLKEDLVVAMKEVYDVHTVKEWQLTYIRPIEIRLSALWTARDKLLTLTSWPRRPIILDEHDYNVDKTLQDRTFLCL